jgi:omega-6 fatty acid desaturase (delta-12 desaturase)
VVLRRVSDHCAQFKGADTKRSVLQFATTASLFVALMTAMILASGGAYWLTLLLAVPAAGLLVRLFIIQHDCGHSSFFRTRRANDVLGRILSLFTLTPFHYWRQHHALHHATSGNLDRRGYGDVQTLTIGEYKGLPTLGRLGYRLYRHPIIWLLVGAPFNFIVLQRLPIGKALPGGGAWRSTMSLNLMLAIVILVLIAFGVAVPAAKAFLPVMLVGSWIGVWLFFVQHQYEGTYWDRGEEWSFHKAAVLGSSYYELPRILRWFTGNIGLHQIHHLCSRIPNYRLQECLDASPELQRLSRKLTFGASLKSMKLALWDENSRKLVAFSDPAVQART